MESNLLGYVISRIRYQTSFCFVERYTLLQYDDFILNIEIHSIKKKKKKIFC